MEKIKKQISRKLKSKGGFTLVELIVVLVIMGILTAAIIPTVTGYVAEAKTKVSESNQYMVEQAALLYLTDWEVNGNDGAPTDLTAQDLVDAGYLSELGDTDYTITYTAIEGSSGRYDVTVEASDASSETSGTDAA